MSKNTVVELKGREEHSDPLTEMLRTGAQKLIHQAVEAELQELLAPTVVRRMVRLVLYVMGIYRNVRSRLVLGQRR